MQWRLWKRLCQATQLFIQSNCVSQVRHWFVRAFWWDRTPVPDSAVYGELNPESSSRELFRGARGLSPRNHCSKGQPTRCLSPSKYNNLQHNSKATFKPISNCEGMPLHNTTSRDHTLGLLEEVDLNMNSCAVWLAFPQSQLQPYQLQQTANSLSLNPVCITSYTYLNRSA